MTSTTGALGVKPMAYVFISAALLLLPARLAAGPLIVDVVGTIAPLSEYANFGPGVSYKDWGNEPFVAVNPVNPQQIVVSGFGYSAPTGSLFYSTDGGTTWGARFPMTSPPGGGSAPNDQTYYYDGNGVLHGAILSSSSGNVYHSTTLDPNKDGFFGRPATVWNWNSTPVSTIGGGQADQPWIAGSGNNVYIAYDDYTSGTGFPRVAASSNGGLSFSSNKLVFLGPPSLNASNPGLRIAADNNNNVYAVHGFASSAGPGLENVSYAINRSVNGGATWQYTFSTPVVGGLPVGSGLSAQIGSSFGGKNELRGNITAIASDSAGNHVYVVYGARDNSHIDRLWLAEFHDVGGNLVERTGPLAFSPVGAAAALPSVTVTANGSLAVMYMTFVSGLYHEHLALSTDLGLTFTDQDMYRWNPSFITLGSSAFPSSNRALGDYNFLTSIGNTIYGTFPGQGFVNGGGYNTTGNVDPLFFTTVVPEPSSIALAALAALGLIGCGWKRRRSNGHCQTDVGSS